MVKGIYIFLSWLLPKTAPLGSITPITWNDWSFIRILLSSEFWFLNNSLFNSKPITAKSSWSESDLIGVMKEKNLSKNKFQR